MSAVHSSTSGEQLFSVAATEDTETGICEPNTTSSTLAPSTETTRLSTAEFSRTQSTSTTAAATAAGTTSTQRVTTSHTSVCFIADQFYCATLCYRRICCRRVSAVCLSVPRSVTSRYCMETIGRIELVFGTEASFHPR